MLGMSWVGWSQAAPPQVRGVMWGAWKGVCVGELHPGGGGLPSLNLRPGVRSVSRMSFGVMGAVDLLLGVGRGPGLVALALWQGGYWCSGLTVSLSLPKHFYQNRAQPPASASRVQSNTTARPGPPAHVYPAASQVMMIPSQISYTPSQGAYYIPGQVRAVPRAPREGAGVGPGLEPKFVLGGGGGYPGSLSCPWLHQGVVRLCRRAAATGFCVLTLDM